MKKGIFLATMILAMASSMAFAQSDRFFNDWKDIDNRGVLDGFDMPGLPAAHGFDKDQSGEAPVGTGLLILTALGAGYAVVKRKVKR